jgi:tubulin beta
VVCDEHVAGGDREYCGDNDTKLDRINMFYHEASGAKYDPRAGPSTSSPGNLGNENAGAGNNWAKAQNTKARHELC